MRLWIFEINVYHALWIYTGILFSMFRQGSTDLPELHRYTMCDAVIDMDFERINQAQLNLAIRTPDSMSRVSCDVKIIPGLGRHVMFYFTDIYLGSPNATESRIDKACIEPRAIHDKYETIIKGMRAIICSKNEVEVGSRVYTTDGNGLLFRFSRNRGYNIAVYFNVVFTAFRRGSCRTSERKCSNDRCIAHDLVCNEHNPCGDYSDCPTGLEHLTNLQMGGIVVLGLLTGGIIIIMAAVCLQRATSKRYDPDDLPIPTNGSVPYDQYPNAEFDDIHTSKPARPKSSDKCRQTTSDRGSISCLHEHSPDNEPLYTDHQDTPLDDGIVFSDQNKHIKQKSTKSVNSDRGKIMHWSHCSPQRDLNIGKPRFSSHSENENTRRYLKHVPCAVSTEVSPKHQADGNLHNAFHLSAHSLVFSDSDSGSDDERLSDKIRSKRIYPECYKMTHMTSS